MAEIRNEYGGCSIERCINFERRDCGADYLNLNNSAGNANWNIGASNFFSYRSV